MPERIYGLKKAGCLLTVALLIFGLTITPITRTAYAKEKTPSAGERISVESGKDDGVAGSADEDKVAKDSDDGHTGTSDDNQSFLLEINPSKSNTYVEGTTAVFSIKVSNNTGEQIKAKTLTVSEEENGDNVGTFQNSEAIEDGEVWEQKSSIVLPKVKEDTETTLEVTLKSNNVQVASEQVVFSVTDIIPGGLPDRITSLDQLYYVSVAKDPTAPFHNAKELKEILEGDNQAYASAVWDKYKYDLYDPNFSQRGGCGALYYPSGNKYSKGPSPGDRPDYGDELLASTGHEYPKDGGTPFHGKPQSKIEKCESGSLRNGGLVNSDGKDIKDLKKSVFPDIGDANKERKYTIDLKAKTDLKQVKPIVLLFQIQTSWQMFDLLHANDRASLVNNKAVTKELLSLYEMKQGFYDFEKWMRQNENKGSLMIGITNFQHKGTFSMFGYPYFTNNNDEIVKGLNGWDSFGDCEHIHYANKALTAAMNALKNPEPFVNWTDEEGTEVFSNAEMVSVIVGGACEAADIKKYDNHLSPISSTSGIKQQYGIRTNSGTGAIANDKISWMDYEAQDGKKFDTGKYYKDVVTRQQFFNTLKDLYENVQEKTSNNQTINDVTISDTVTAEFGVEASEIKAFVNNKDVTAQAKITVVQNADGTTTVSCNFGAVGHNKNVHLQIPVKAKDSFIGSNNVYTNTGTPVISHKGRIEQDKTFTYKFTDTPAVNVPIRFDVNDGGNAVIVRGEGQTVNLADLARDENGNNIMTNDVEALLEKYDQTEGTLTYQWVDSDGNAVGNPTSAPINEKEKNPPEIPSYTVTESNAKPNYSLRVTFTPAALKEGTTSKVAVSQCTKEGEVTVSVVEPTIGKLYIKKDVVNYAENKKNDEFMIKAESRQGDDVNTELVLKHGETSNPILVTEKTNLKISEIMPMEYSLTGYTISGKGADDGDLVGNEIRIKPGDSITVTVHNRYEWKPYFHSFSSITNKFVGHECKKCRRGQMTYED